MLAAVYEGIGKITIKKMDKPALKTGSLLIKVKACAICGTDLKIFRKGNPRVKPPQVIGHEFVGEIVEIGQGVEGFHIGERVTMATSISCGRCIFCQQGLNNLCNDLKPISYDFPGAFSEYMLIPPEGVTGGNVLKVPDGLSDEEAALSEPLGCVINGQMIADVGLGNTVVVIGAGPIGCLHTEVARARGATKIILTEVLESRLEMAKAFDIDVLINSSKEDPVLKIKELTEGMGADVVIAAAPSSQAQEQSLEMVKKNGTVNLFASIPKENSYIKVDSRLIHYNQIRITGASDSTAFHQRIALDMLNSGKINTGALITHHLPLADLLKGLTLLENGEGLKIIIHP